MKAKRTIRLMFWPAISISAGKAARAARVSFEGGYSVGRAIHYKDLDETVNFDPSPYVQASVRWWF